MRLLVDRHGPRDAARRMARVLGWGVEEDGARAICEGDALDTLLLGRSEPAARVPDSKTLGELDVTVSSGLSRQKVLELASCAYLEQGEAVVIVGPIGAGTAHLAIALGIEAARRRKRVAFVRFKDDRSDRGS